MTKGAIGIARVDVGMLRGPRRHKPPSENPATATRSPSSCATATYSSTASCSSSACRRSSAGERRSAWPWCGGAARARYIRDRGVSRASRVRIERGRTHAVQEQGRALPASGMNVPRSSARRGRVVGWSRAISCSRRPKKVAKENLPTATACISCRIEPAISSPKRNDTAPTPSAPRPGRGAGGGHSALGRCRQALPRLY